MYCSNCYLFTCIQISQEASQVVWYSHLFKNFHNFLLIYIKGFSIVSEAKVDVFLEFSSFFYDPVNVGNLISGSSAFSKSSLHIWKFSVHILLKPVLKHFKYYFASMWDECNCVLFEYSLALPFFGMEWKLRFSSPVATAKFSKFAGILSAALSQHHLLGFEIAQAEFHHLH